MGTAGWWLNLTYINIFYQLICMGWTWYLSVDMMFYLLSPFLIMALYKNRKVGLTIMFLLFAGCVTTVAYLTKTYEIQPTEAAAEVYFDPWLFRIFVRPSSWGVGMVTGYLLFVTKMKIKMNKAVVFTGWTICTGVFLSLIFAYYSNGLTSLPVNVATLYNSVNRPSWSFCLSWIVIACSCGYGGYVTSLLDWPIFMPLSKLTYSAYLVHYFVLQWYLAIQDAPLRLSTMNLTYYILGSIFVTFALAYILAVLIEWPTIGIIKLIFPRAKSKRESEKQDDSHQLEMMTKNEETDFESKPPSYKSSTDHSQKDSKEDLTFQQEKENGLKNQAYEKD